MENTHTIEVTCILTDNQFQRLQNITNTLNNHFGKNWTNQMTLQSAVGNPHLSEMILLMLETYVEENIKERA